MCNSTISQHAHRDGNGNTALLVDSKTKRIQHWDFCCKFDSDYVDYESNSRDMSSWCEILQDFDGGTSDTHALMK